MNGEDIETTPWHLFYTDEGWVEAGDLEPGDLLFSLGGVYGQVESILIEERTQTMYDLTVEEVHTFAVGDGDWVVHNCNDIDPNSQLGQKLSRIGHRIVDLNGELGFFLDDSGKILHTMRSDPSTPFRLIPSAQDIQFLSSNPDLHMIHNHPIVPELGASVSLARYDLWNSIVYKHASIHAVGRDGNGSFISYSAFRGGGWPASTLDELDILLHQARMNVGNTYSHQLRRGQVTELWLNQNNLHLMLQSMANDSNSRFFYRINSIR